jgi:hypothetical protein
LNHQKNPSQMKTNLYILLILLLSFSAANAQESSTEVTVITVNEINVNNPVSEITKEVSTTENNETTINENEETNNVEVIARYSDIKIYLNQIRKVQNIILLFPKFNKNKVA